MSRAKKPWLYEETTDITFHVYCGNPAITPHERVKFSFTEKAPKSYTKRVTPREPGPSKSTVHQFISTLIDKHDNEIFKSKTWKCAICNCFATKLCYTSMQSLAPPCDCHFEPTVRVYGIPACQGRGGRNCGRLALASLDSYDQTLFPDHDMNPLRCNVCRVKNGVNDAVVKRCTGCKKVSYCGKEHQRMDWHEHKFECRRVQKEEADPKYAEIQGWRKHILG